MKKYNLRKAAAAAAAGAMLLSNMGYAQEANVYDQTKEDLQGKKMILTTAEDWWNDTYQGIVDKYCEEFGVEMEVNILPAEKASEVIKSQLPPENWRTLP